MSDAISAMFDAYAQLSAGRADVPLRSRIAVPAHDGTALFMPAYLPDGDDLGIKVVAVFPENAGRQLPIIHATVLVLDAATGRPQALLEGGTLTAVRTGAASGAATSLLARPEAETVAILGSGVQARTQLEAVCTVRDIKNVRIYSPNHSHATAFAQMMAGHNNVVPGHIDVAGTPADAVRGADIICAATTSTTPVFSGTDLSPGTHINAVGSYTPQMQEVDVETIRRSLVVVDSRAAVLAEAGDLIIPLQTGAIHENHIHAELGEIVSGQKAGRTNPEQITYFKSVGVAVQDLAAARVALRNAVAQNLGTEVSLWQVEE